MFDFSLAPVNLVYMYMYMNDIKMCLSYSVFYECTCNQIVPSFQSALSLLGFMLFIHNREPVWLITMVSIGALNAYMYMHDAVCNLTALIRVTGSEKEIKKRYTCTSIKVYTILLEIHVHAHV